MEGFNRPLKSFTTVNRAYRIETLKYYILMILKNSKKKRCASCTRDNPFETLSVEQTSRGRRLTGGKRHRHPLVNLTPRPTRTSSTYNQTKWEFALVFEIMNKLKQRNDKLKLWMKELKEFEKMKDLPIDLGSSRESRERPLKDI